MKRWLKRPEGSNWGDFGADDQVGRMNLITPERRRAALAEAREGIAFLLGLPLDHPKGQIFPGRFPPRLAATSAGADRPMYDWTPSGGATDVVNDDRVTMDLQYSSQWDGLSHYGACFDADDDGIAEHVFYNGYRSDTHFTQPAEGVAPHAHALGIERLAQTCVQGRGVLVDVRDAGTPPHGRIGHAALMRAIEAQGADVAEGDLLCLYTGYGDLLLRDGAGVNRVALAACPGLDGGDPALLDWIGRSGLAAICADNPMVEKIDGLQRCTGKAMLPLHEHCLVKLGIHLGEFWWFGGIAPWLAAHGRAHFLLTAPPLNLPGAVGSPATPIGTV
ncbi:cyclase family protein [Sphingomonas solaris]|uniref:Cyclase family protein n=1 Tax=Alterirhizorhabdus solaris TaxID=2529389 RepID=A0A558R3I4_9SPHN|nr:cyclase family protein [Sphingomonas solaris]TVV73912.1 cyclase family protein [Sphingomonas solaris]